MRLSFFISLNDFGSCLPIMIKGISKPPMLFPIDSILKFGEIFFRDLKKFITSSWREVDSKLDFSAIVRYLSLFVPVVNVEASKTTRRSSLTVFISVPIMLCFSLLELNNHIVNQ